MKEAWDFFWEQVIPIIGLKNFAIIEFLIIVALIVISKYYFDKEVRSYKRELAIKDTTIQGLSIELENSKQYSPSFLIQNLGQHIKEYENEVGRLNEKLGFLNNEVETETRKKSIIEQEKSEIQKKLDLAQSDILALRQRLEPLEKELDYLIGEMAEPDFCRVCDVDDDHIMMNTIGWGFGGEKLAGDTALIEKKGVCSYCGSTNLKCKVCGTVTGIDSNSNDEIECEGGCGNVYTLLSFMGDKSMQYVIKISRMALDAHEK